MIAALRSGRGRSTLGKRVVDIVAGTILLLLTAPISLAVAAIVRSRLGSPVIYRQQRPGLGGRAFTICKFRTMIHETVDADGNEISSERRTPAWAYKVRSMSLDELPELWNVIKGDMSLVGPRPLLMDYLPRYTPEQARRHEVRPGITGLAQVSGRNALTWDQKFALDVEYVDRHDLRMDIDILLRTVKTVFAREGIRHTDTDDMPLFTGDPAADADRTNG